MSVQVRPESALQVAVSHRDQDRVRALIAQGEDPDVPGPMGHTALHTAAARDEPVIAQELIDAGARIDSRDDAGNTPLLVAVTAPTPSLAVAGVLLEARADPDAPNEAGATPRALALARGRSDLRKLFADSDASAHAIPLVRVPKVEVAASTPSKLTLDVDGSAITFPGELVLTAGGSTDRILRIGAMTAFDDGSPLDPALRPLILSYLTARRALYEA
jgi:ankyrin repeat protein